MRNLMGLFVVLALGVTASAQQQLTPKERFLADNPNYKERVTAFYSQKYLPGAVRTMTEAIRSPGFRDADADRILREWIGRFLDEWIQVGGDIPEEIREQVLAPMNLQVRRLDKDEKAFQRYLTWRHSADNSLAFLLPLGQGANLQQGKQAKAIRVLIADSTPDESAIAKRLRKLKFDVVVFAWDKIDPGEAKNSDVIFLATHWGEQFAFPGLEAKKAAFHKFVQRGGGLVASQPNPSGTRTCTPTLLPYPITFDYHYDQKDPTCINLAQDHFITEDLAHSKMPFPHDRMLKVDPRYRVLAKQKSTDSPSLVVCNFGDGRVVVQTNAESDAANIPLGDEILRRMIVWAAGREQGETR